MNCVPGNGLISVDPRLGKPTSPKLLGVPSSFSKFVNGEPPAKFRWVYHCWLRTVSAKNVGENTWVNPRPAATVSAGVDVSPLAAAGNPGTASVAGDVAWRRVMSVKKLSVNFI